MKKIALFIIVAFLFANSLKSQIVDGITYQAVALDDKGKEIAGMDANGNVIHSKSINVRFSILESSSTGNMVYQETHLTNTDPFGLFSVVIGHGEITSSSSNSSILDIKWGNSAHFLKVEIDIKGFSDYKLMGVQQMMAVPYALYSLNAGNITNSSSLDTSITNELQFLRLSNDTIYLSKGGFVKLPGAFTGDYNDLINKPVLVTTFQEGFMSSFDKTKLNGITDGAEPNVNADWNAVNGDALILNKPVEVSITVSGLMSFSDKIKLDGMNPAALVNVNPDWNATIGAAFILNKPALFSGNYNDLMNKPVDVTTSVSGFMSSTDKIKLDGITIGFGANVNADWNAVSGDALILNKPTISEVREIDDEFISTVSQTSFFLSQSPHSNSKVKMLINGVRISKSAYSISGTTLTYIPANNGSNNLVAGDRIQFEYYY